MRGNAGWKAAWRLVGRVAVLGVLCTCLLLQAVPLGTVAAGSVQETVRAPDANHGATRAPDVGRAAQDPAANQVRVRITNVSAETGRATVTLNVTSPDNDRYALGRGAAVVSVLETRNLERRDDDPDWYRVADRDAPATMRLRVRFERNETDGYRWALVSTRQFVRIGYFPTTNRFEFRGAGPRTAATETFTYYGNPQVEQRSRNGFTVRVVAREGSRFASNPDALFETAFRSREALDIGARNPGLTIFARPESRAFAVGRGGGDSIWVSSQLDNPVPTTAHEFVHTRQRFNSPRNATERTRWLTEATADYLGSRIAYRRCAIGGGYEEFVRRNTVDDHENARLTRPETWEGRGAPYDKGGRVLAALDVRVREATDGQATLVDIVRRLNRQDRVTLASFERAAEETAGRQFDEFIDRYVTGTGVPNASVVPEDPTAFGFERCPSDDPSTERPPTPAATSTPSVHVSATATATATPTDSTTPRPDESMATPTARATATPAAGATGDDDAVDPVALLLDIADGTVFEPAVAATTSTLGQDVAAAAIVSVTALLGIVVPIGGLVVLLKLVGAVRSAIGAVIALLLGDSG